MELARAKHGYLPFVVPSKSNDGIFKYLGEEERQFTSPSGSFDGLVGRIFKTRDL
jgi:hypothetical protein